MVWKDFFYYSRKERLGILVFLILIGLAFVAWTTLLYLEKREQWETLENDSAWQACYDSFRVSLHRRELRYPEYPVGMRSSYRKPDYFLFDPNKADSLDFIKMGLPPFVAHNILRYRAKGGVFRKPEAMGRIYGLSAKDFKAIRPYIQIGTAFESSYRDTLPDKDKYVYERPFKYAPGTVIDLNAADSSSLKKIPGIGSSTARRIVLYRESLGGFFQISQLREIRNFPDSLMKWFRIQTPPRKVLLINRFGVEHLAAHPYLNFYQAKVIVEHRRKRGALSDLKSLSLYEEFSPSDLERLAPYVQF